MGPHDEIRAGGKRGARDGKDVARQVMAVGAGAVTDYRRRIVHPANGESMSAPRIHDQVVARAERRAGVGEDVASGSMTGPPAVARDRQSRCAKSTG